MATQTDAARATHDANLKVHACLTCAVGLSYFPILFLRDPRIVVFVLSGTWVATGAIAFSLYGIATSLAVLATARLRGSAWLVHLLALGVVAAYLYWGVFNPSPPPPWVEPSPMTPLP